MITLTVMSGPEKGKRYNLPEGRGVIGRDSKLLPLRDQTCSRRHAEIVPGGVGGPGTWSIKDLGSSNGTFVNGQRALAAMPLRPGDQVRLGRTLLMFGVQPGVRPGGNLPMAGRDDGMDSSIIDAIPSTLHPSTSPTDAGKSTVEDSLMDSVFGDESASRAAHQNLTTLYRLSAALGASFSEEQVLEVVMDLVFESIKADRGSAMLLDPTTGEPKPIVTRTKNGHNGDHGEDADGSDEGDAAAPASRTIVSHVLERDEAVSCSNAMADERFSAGNSVQHMRIRSAMCVPIRCRRVDTRPQAVRGPASLEDLEPTEQTLGVIYVDSAVDKVTYSDEQLRLLAAIGWQAGLALQNAKLYRQGLQAERLAAVGETTAALSHGIKNILQALRGGADNVEMGFDRGNLRQARKGWRIVDRNLGRIYQLTMNLLAWSKRREPKLEVTAIVGLVDECLELIAPAAKDRGVMAVAELEDVPPLPVDAGGMHQVLMNLLTNALEAFDSTDDDRERVIKVTGSYEPDIRRLTIEVADTAGGIEPGVREHLFELFHSTKGNRGTGLGLPVVRKIVQEHEGEVRVDSRPGEGTRFTIVLPIQLRPDDDPSGTIDRA